jgi:hypothetical protein
VRVRVHGPGTDWSGLREIVVLVLFILFFGLACLQAGYILRDWQKDETRERIHKLETKFTDHDGRIVLLEGPGHACVPKRP